MASQQSIADYIVERLTGAGVTARKMFGEFGLFSEGKMVTLICDDQLYVKPTAAGRSFLCDCGEGQPYPRAKLHFLISGEGRGQIGGDAPAGECGDGLRLHGQHRLSHHGIRHRSCTRLINPCAK